MVKAVGVAPQCAGNKTVSVSPPPHLQTTVRALNDQVALYVHRKPIVRKPNPGVVEYQGVGVPVRDSMQLAAQPFAVVLNQQTVVRQLDCPRISRTFGRRATIRTEREAGGFEQCAVQDRNPPSTAAISIRMGSHPRSRTEQSVRGNQSAAVDVDTAA